MATLASAGLTSYDREPATPKRGAMPFEIRQQGSRFCVFTKGTDHNHGCHPTREKAMAQMRALYANVPEAQKQEGHFITVQGHHIFISDKETHKDSVHK